MMSCHAAVHGVVPRRGRRSRLGSPEPRPSSHVAHRGPGRAGYLGIGSACLGAYLGQVEVLEYPGNPPDAGMMYPGRTDATIGEIETEPDPCPLAAVT